MAYVYREKPHRWTGPHRVLNRADKSVTLLLPSGPTPFNICQTRPAPIDDPTPVKEAPFYTHITEIIDPADPRAQLFGAAKKEELLGLIEKGTFEVVTMPEIDKKLNILPSRFVLTIKKRPDGSERFKARFVIGGHRDRLRGQLVHVSSTLQQTHARVLIALAAVLGFPVWTVDIQQAYLQSATPLLRDVYVKPDPQAIRLGNDELLRLLKPLYGLEDAGDYWAVTLSRFHTDHLGLQQTAGDFALFFRSIRGRLLGMSGSYVDDLIQSGTRAFREEMQRELQNNFSMNKPEHGAFTFAGIQYEDSGEIRELHQKSYIEKLQPLGRAATFDEFRSRRASMAWIAHTRPDICCAVGLLAQTTTATFSAATIKALNSTIKYLHDTKDLTLKFPRLDMETLCMVVYADSSFGNASNNASQQGYLVVLTDKSRRYSILAYKSYKSKRVVRSSTAGETLALADAFDIAHILRHDLQRMLQRHIPILLLTDSESLFKTLTNARYPTERRLLIDVAAMRQAYTRKEISNIALIDSNDNAADGLTKLKPNQALYRMLRAGRLDHRVRQWVIEEDMRSARTQEPREISREKHVFRDKCSQV
jgi:hypothetical protein